MEPIGPGLSNVHGSRSIVIVTEDIIGSKNILKLTMGLSKFKTSDNISPVKDKYELIMTILPPKALIRYQL
jgi:hypothetical protein